MSATAMSETRIHISCLVDDNPVMRMQAWNWLISLSKVKAGCSIFVHHTPSALSESQKRIFASLGATLIEVEEFGTGDAKYCNKIKQLSNQQFLNCDYIILSDADIFYAQDPATAVRPGTFCAKLVDLPNPSQLVCNQIFEYFGIAQPSNAVELELSDNAKTFSTNFNGGFYAFPAEIARDLESLWTSYARKCLALPEVLGNKRHHSDQIAIGLALINMEIPTHTLTWGHNFPTHLPIDTLGRIAEQPIFALHYHKNMDNHGLPCLTGIDWIDQTIHRARTSLIEARRENFSNAIFWDFRYDQYPQLGSGLGSRGEPLKIKQRLLEDFFNEASAGTVLDVGSGDLETTRHLQITDYLGIDLSETAIKTGREKRPDWNFLQAQVADLEDKAFDYSFCFDVLIHQDSEIKARELIGHLIRVTRQVIFFTSHSTAESRSGISFNTYDAPRWFTIHSRDLTVERIGEYRDVNIYCARL